MISHNITKKTQGKRHGAGQMADNLNWNHQWCQPEKGADKLFQIFDTMFFPAEVMSQEKYCQSTGCSGIEVAGWWIESGDQAGKV